MRSRAPNLGAALLRLRDSMRANEFKSATPPIFLDRMIRAYDGRTRAEGFHVLHDWDGVSQQVNPDIIPVDVLHFLIEQRGAEPATAIELAILLDYYFAHVLQLLTPARLGRWRSGPRTWIWSRSCWPSCRDRTAAASGLPPTPKRCC